MTVGSLDVVVVHARRMAEPSARAGLTDGELLESFRVHRNGAAFTALMLRHGRLVRSVCRQILRHQEDVEDAFQAAFLVLALKAGSIRSRNSISSWLYGVAYKTAMTAHRSATRRNRYESKACNQAQTSPDLEAAGRELQAIVAAEVQRLPEKHRAPFLLCCLEGKTKAEAGKELGWKEGTVSGRLAEARKILRFRLARRGVALSALLSLGALSGQAPASAELAALSKAATLLAAGAAPESSGVSCRTAALIEEVVQAMFVASLKTGLCLVLFGVLATGVGVLGNCVLAGHFFAEAAEKPDSVQAQVGIVGGPGPVDLLGDPLPDGALARIGTTRFRADSSICVAALSPDGRWAAFGTELGRAYVCEAASGKPVFDMQVDPVNARPVSELMFSPDSKTLVASGLWSKALWLIDIASNKITHSFPNTSDEQLTWSRFRQGPCFAFLQNGKSLVVGGKDGAIHIWNTASRTERVLLETEKDPVISLTVTADGRTALSAHRDGTLHFWDLVDQKHLRKLNAVLKDPHLTVLAPDGKIFTVETGVGTLELRDRDGVCRHQLKVTNEIVGLAFTPDGSMLRTADTGGIVTTWQVSNGKVQASLTCEGVANSMASKMNPRPAAWFRPDGTMMAWACGDLLRLWDLQTGLEKPKVTDFIRGLQWAGFSADGKTLHLGGNDGELGAWDTVTLKPKFYSRFAELKNGIHFMPASDRRKILIVANRNDLFRNKEPGMGRIFTWDLDNDNRLTALSEQAAPSWNATLTPDNHSIVATELDEQIRVYVAETGKLERSFKGRKFEYKPTLSPDGALLATCSADWAIRIYDFASGRILRDWKTSSPAGSLAFSPDGRMLASGHTTMPPRGVGKEFPGDFIYLWNVESGKELRRMQTNHRVILSLCFSPDGRLIASCGVDKVVHLCEVSSGQVRRDYVGHKQNVAGVDFSPDGQRLASASSDGTALIWGLFDPAPVDRNAQELDRLWDDLAKDGTTAHRAMGALRAAKASPAFLTSHLKPAAIPSDDKVKQWLTDLGSPVFSTRETAQAELASVAGQIEPSIRNALQTTQDPEVRRRLTAMIENLPALVARPDLLRELRGLEGLEHIGDNQSRRKVVELAAGAPNANLTHQAKASLERLKRKMR